MRFDRRPSFRVPSLRVRVTAGASAILALALLITALTVAGLLRRSIENESTAVLIDRIDAVASLIATGDLPAVLEPTGREIGQVQVVDGNGVVVSRTPGLGTTARLNVFEGPALGKQVITTVDGGGIDNDPNERYKAIARTVGPETAPLTIYAVTTLDPAVRAEEYLRARLLLVLPLLVAVAAFVIFRVVGRALAPVDAMRADVDRIEATDLSGRVTPGSTDDEIAKLGATLNHMLDRLERSTMQQRLFAAAASHELRSPLSAIRTELEVGLAYPDRTDWEQTVANSIVEIERLERLGRDLRTFTNSGTGPLRSTDVFDLGDLVATELARRPGCPSIVHSSRITQVLVRGEADSMLQVVRNLLDNAERHASSRVTVWVDAVGQVATLTVHNDGPSLPADMRELVFEPFMRLDAARSVDTGGSGLGLAISRSIMTAHGGSIDVADVGAGTSFVARLPLVVDSTEQDQREDRRVAPRHHEPPALGVGQ
jgi:signal transduction histidine kinase